MIEPSGPCGHESDLVRLFIIIVNAVQALGIAYIANRAWRKNGEEQSAKRQRQSDD